ncbi:MAG: response regulator [Spirochaetales bacterium]|nr:response regulator [Spirochaetales bacterium]
MAHILIVDDDPAVRGNTARLLSGKGHTVVEAESGDQALRYVDEAAVDLVIMDIVMPKKGGVEAIMEIHARHPRIPAVVMSGKVPLGTAAVDSLMEHCGSKAVLSKPFTAAELLAAVEKALACSS